MPSRSEDRKAIGVERFRIWFAWLAGNLAMYVIASACSGFAVVDVLTKLLFAVVFLASTVTAYRMHLAANRHADQDADQERPAVLGGHHQG